MREVAGLYQDEGERQKYQNAASRFRLPFWDPFMPRNQPDDTKPKETIFGVPEILRVENVFVKHWNLKTKSIPNPLERFSFPSEDTLKAQGRAIIDWRVKRKDGSVGYRVVSIYGLRARLEEYCVDVYCRLPMGKSTRFEPLVRMGKPNIMRLMMKARAVRERDSISKYNDKLKR